MSRHRKLTTAITGLIVAAAIAGAYLIGRSDERAGRPFALANPAQAAESPAISPVKARPRDTYFPNSEDLLPDEMRVIACVSAGLKGSGYETDQARRSSWASDRTGGTRAAPDGVVGRGRIRFGVHL